MLDRYQFKQCKSENGLENNLKAVKCCIRKIYSGVAVHKAQEKELVINDSDGKDKAWYGSHTKESGTVFTQGSFRGNVDT